MDPDIRHSCGLFGVFGSWDAALMVYQGLQALQHRGQESAGLVSEHAGRFHVERGMGYVPGREEEKLGIRGSSTVPLLPPNSKALGLLSFCTIMENLSPTEARRPNAITTPGMAVWFKQPVPETLTATFLFRPPARFPRPALLGTRSTGHRD